MKVLFPFMSTKLRWTNETRNFTEFCSSSSIDDDMERTVNDSVAIDCRDNDDDFEYVP